MSDKLVLVVDDNEDVRTMLCALLEIHNVNVKPLKDGSDALVFLKQNPSVKPILLISDLMMNQVDGIDLLASIRKDKSYDQMMFVLHTGADLSVFSSLLKPYKIDAIIPKPSNPDRLEAELLKLIDKASAMASKAA